MQGSLYTRAYMIDDDQSRGHRQNCTEQGISIRKLLRKNVLGTNRKLLESDIHSPPKNSPRIFAETFDLRTFQ